MSGDGLGHIIDMRELPESRRALTITANDFGQTNVTLMGGLIGTPDGDEVTRQAADRRALAFTPRKPKRQRVKGV